MIHTAKQLKDKISNLSKSNSDVAKMLIRNFIMERFLERVSVSPYNNWFPLIFYHILHQFQWTDEFFTYFHLSTSQITKNHMAFRPKVSTTAMIAAQNPMFRPRNCVVPKSLIQIVVHFIVHTSLE